ncbi:MAG: DAK2 domain-containing protein [Oscillospiraceae bacterium]|nr:DAK2 domain-containing protein [Oscillospiraceae bacterium]
MLDGKTLRDAVISGANQIFNNRETVDELNVFPVPDGDTGANMSATMKSTLAELSLAGDDCDIGIIAEKVASAMLRGARGNSGVILSLLFRGLSKGLAGKSTATPSEFCESLEMGVKAAYKSVMKPTEGTILTVSREASAAAANSAKDGGDFAEVFDVLVKEAKSSLDRTPELLPVLKKAGVVDSGGMGYLYIIEGMKSVVDGKGIVERDDPDAKNATPVVGSAAGTFEGEIEFTYCTEYLVRKKPDTNDITALRAFLESIGDSVVAVDDDEIIKVHVHTDNPGKALEEGLLFGQLINIKVENMREQHKGETVKAQQKSLNKLPPKSPENKYGFVAVVAGAGLEELFKDLGVDCIVRGGQTFNPSTEDIIEAILATPAYNVFVLPNNKNIILAAEQAQKVIKDRNVVVLQSRTIPQGISALLSFNADEEVRENSVQMTLSLDKVSTGAITFAVRDSDFEEKKIKKNDILALENGKLTYVEKDVTKALVKITKRMVKSDSSYVTVMYGVDISEAAAEESFKQVKAKVSNDVEVVLINGGQPVYYYIVSVE